MHVLSENNMKHVSLSTYRTGVTLQSHFNMQLTAYLIWEEDRELDDEIPFV